MLSCKDNSPKNIFEVKSTAEVEQATTIHSSSNDTIIYFIDFKSKFVDSRNVEVWLPKNYPEKNVKYQVLYMHDGQNVFNKETSYSGVAWEIEEKVDSLLAINAIRPTIVVGIWNNGEKRFSEYMPQLPKSLSESAFAKAELKKNFGSDKLLSDNYLKFMTQELLPFVNEKFQTSKEPEHTITMGASMGAHISLYAMIKYPDTFGKAGCLSTHWPIPYLGQAFMDELPTSVPEPTFHKIYFDHGTKTLDKVYEPHQLKVNDMFYQLGYTDQNLLYRKFEGHEHSEKYWQQRVALPLEFLLK
ncbi:putative alpha/beta superfamily hydrolase [Nonlabens dokdonensis]|uniref:Alpha/beta superfamily hydrolase n=2 Tax=Nonlabens dokdonensis TaxID=328515 RepID=A0ABX5PV27_9FLAO|nr:putative alpha/beta superfamily hydrolase [Nonlabens dokdonensis]